MDIPKSRNSYNGFDMTKETNYLSGVFLLSGSLLASGAYLAVYHFYSPAAWMFFLITVLLALFGLVKMLNYLADFLPAPLKRAIQWIHSMVFEAVAVATTFLLRLPGHFSKGSASSPDKAGRPILMIHGYLHDPSAWVYLKRDLANAGFGPVYTLHLTHPFRSIRDYAEIVAKKAKEIAKETGRTDLSLIGHSMGGLVSAWYALKVAVPEKAMDVITIGSPLKGTCAANIAIGPNGREMRRGSDFIRELQKEIGQTDRKFYHVASMADQLILPWLSALTGRHPEREYVLDDIGHMTLLLSPRVATQIKTWLEKN